MEIRHLEALAQEHGWVLEVGTPRDPGDHRSGQRVSGESYDRVRLRRGGAEAEFICKRDGRSLEDVADAARTFILANVERPRSRRQRR